MSFCFLIHLWICPKHHYFPGLYLLTSVNQSLSSNSIQDSLNVLVRHSTQYQGKRALCYCQRWRWSHTCLFEPKIEIQLKGMRCYYGPQNSALRIKIVYTKKHSEECLKTKILCPGYQSVHHPVLIMQDLSPISLAFQGWETMHRRGRNPAEQEQALPDAPVVGTTHWRFSTQFKPGPHRPSEWYGFASTFQHTGRKSPLG